MKKIIFGLLSITSFSITAQVDFTMKATNKPSDSILIRNRGTSKWIVADKKGEFKSKLEVSDGFYQLKLGEQYTSLYLKNGIDLIATVDYNKFDESLKYSGKGAKENNFLAKRIATQNDKDYEAAMNATDEKQLSTEINKIKEGIFNTIPKDLEENFTTQFKKNTEAELAGLEKYIQQSFGLKKLNGTISPTFNYENHKGGNTKLEDFKGKYVYIDMWATWCGPCRAEIPHLKNLEKEMHGKNIEFVSISIDQAKDKEKWQKFVTEKELGGVQLIANQEANSDFLNFYSINSIPRFILLDPSGKIVNADAPRPSSKEIKEVLKGLLN